MFSPNVISLRNKFRAQLDVEFPSLSPIDIFTKLKNQESNKLNIVDLAPICERANIPVNMLEKIFSPYNNRDSYISQKKFESFYKDEYLNSTTKVTTVNETSPENSLILRSFCNALKAKKKLSATELWSYVVRHNVSQTEQSRARVATLCRLSDEYNMPFNAARFIDAMFEFYGRKMESINFQEFLDLITTFG